MQVKDIPKPMLLIILDGWGYREDQSHNPTRAQNLPTFDHLFADHPYILLNASGESVGLPPGQMGNSEVGHLHIGSGRKVPQDLTRIGHAITTHEFANNPIFLQGIKVAKENNSAVHILGLLSPGGVHSHESHILALINLLAEHGIQKNYLHAILDGRDTPPQSAKASLEKIANRYEKLPGGQIASIVGRYYAMDRDKRWDRTQQAYDMLTEGNSEFSSGTAIQALEMAYTRGETDEFVKPTCIIHNKDKPIVIEDGDVVIFMNFRADRARQLTQAFTDKSFNAFPRAVTPKLADFITLTEYAKDIKAQVAFPKLTLKNTLGEYLAQQGKKQLRIAETEKYAHVTYFLNGGIEKPFKKEDRLLIASPKVATYDLQPEMSAAEVTDKLCEAIESNTYDAIVCNYANTDMVGHTGSEQAANQAITTIDVCLKRVLQSLHKVGGEALITADHGNIEQMYDDKHQQPHTAHTTNLVPLIFVGRHAHFIQQQGALDDIAPTMLYLMGLSAPTEMTGHNLLQLDNDD